SGDVLDNGDINWGGTLGDGGGVATDQTGSGTSYEYRWPCCINNGTLATDFFIVNEFAHNNSGTSLGSHSRTTGLITGTDIPAMNQGQWPFLGTVNFAVNPIDPSALVISSAGTKTTPAAAGNVYLTSGDSLGYGVQWFQIANQADMGNDGLNS